MVLCNGLHVWATEIVSSRGRKGSMFCHTSFDMALNDGEDDDAMLVIVRKSKYTYPMDAAYAPQRALVYLKIITKA